jgi:protein required for attachment to host cells
MGDTQNASDRGLCRQDGRIDMRTWILVSSAYIARVFELDSLTSPWREVYTWVNPEDRLRRQDLNTDRPGRIASPPRGQRSSYADPSDPRQKIDAAFAKDVIRELRVAHDEGRFERLVVVAPPHFMGLLRQFDRGRLTAVVFQEVRKDFTHETAASLQRRLRELI